MTPKASVRVIGQRGSVELEAIIDTGFDGDLCLPIDAALQLGLELHGRIAVELADGSRKLEFVFLGQVEFQGQGREAPIVLPESEDALIGTALLARYRLTVDFGTGEIVLTKSRKGRSSRRDR